MDAPQISRSLQPILSPLIRDLVEPFDEFIDGLGLGFLTMGSAQPSQALAQSIYPLRDAPGLGLIIEPLRMVLEYLGTYLGN
jgi:hypothetical protein